MKPNKYAKIQSEQEVLTREEEFKLTLEAQVYLAFKHKTPDRMRLLDKLVRAYVDPYAKTSAKRKYLSEKAKKILKAVLLKIINGEKVILNHKYISEITRCKANQNAFILKELKRILKYKFYRVYTNENGQRFSRHYHFELNPEIVNELKEAGNFYSEFYPRFFVGTYNNNRKASNEANRSRSDLVSLQKTLQIKKQPSDLQGRVVSAKITHTTTKRRKTTKQERKARVYKPKFKQYPKMEDLGYHYPLTAKDCSELQAISSRDFTLNVMNEILLSMSTRLHRTFCSKAQFYAYFAKALRHEKRDAVQCSGNDFYIKANKSEAEIIEITTQSERENYLNKEETAGIHTRCDYTQVRAKIAGTLPPNLGYNLLTGIVGIRKRGLIFEMIMTKTVELTEHYKQLVLAQANAIGSYNGVEELKMEVSNADKI